MKLRFKGHDYKFAVEQMMLTMFPEERPEYAENGESLGENSALVELTESEKYFVARALISKNGKAARSSTRYFKRGFASALEKDSVLTHIIKDAFFKAAVKLTGDAPEWGSMTGIRPAKIATAAMEKGGSIRAADRELRDRYYVSPERRRLCIDSASASLGVKRELKREEISLYIGIPFCPTRCAYCSFVSNSVEKSMKLVQPYLDALFLEIEDAARRVKELGLRIKTVYYGGGTPTTLTTPQITALMDKVAAEFDLSHVEEYTVEAGRPDTVNEEKLRALKSHGVTRVSINPQTMRNSVLEAIGRSHTEADILRAYDEARRVGFESINMDLIAGLPGDDEAGFEYSLDRVLSLEPENVTVHTLSLKKGSRLRLEGRGSLPEAGQVGRMLEYSRKRLTEQGYGAYYLYRQKFMAGNFENVGWARPGHSCLYNIIIMEELHTILSLGAGGTTKLVDPDITRIERLFNPKYPYEYIERIDSIMKNKDYMHDYYAVMRARQQD